MTAKVFLQLTPEEKNEIFSVIETRIGLPPAAIEKDWWVVQILNIVFQMEIAPHTVFKGGTSLSKAWGIIERFSEDIDLALSRKFFGFEDKISREKIKKLRRESLGYLKSSLLPELEEKIDENGFENVSIDILESGEPDQDPVQIAIHYPNVTKQSEYIEPKVVLEIGSRAMKEPFSDREFCSIVGEQFQDRSFADEKITIPCVNPERTFLEKLFLLHEEFQRPAEKVRVDRLSRHLYDIYRIGQTEYAEIAIKDQELYQSIVAHRKKFTRLGGVDYQSHYPPNLNPIPPDHLIDSYQKDYQKMQREMILGESLGFGELITEIRKIVEKINY